MSTNTVGVSADGSAEGDAGDRVVIDGDDPSDRWRYRCPNNHTRWSPTNNHLFCSSCSQQADAGEGPEYWKVLDTKTSEEIPWSRVVFK